MVFVLLGTQDKSFERLLLYVLKAKEDGILKERLVVQKGITKLDDILLKAHEYDIPKDEIESLKENFNTLLEDIHIFDFASQHKLKDFMNEAEFVICHAGVGTILDALKQEKKVLSVPRLLKYKEHTNDHQLEIIQELTKDGNIQSAQTYDEFKNAIENMGNFNPKPYKYNNEKFVENLEEYIQSI